MEIPEWVVSLLVSCLHLELGVVVGVVSSCSSSFECVSSFRELVVETCGS